MLFFKTKLTAKSRLTPLHLAAQNEKDDPSAAKLLLENGADINASTPEVCAAILLH